MTECPECGYKLELKDMEQGEIFSCKDCGVELELFSLEPPVVKLAPEEEEDWGE
ncbi:MAG: lysine biosynthesis protein LysW [Thermoplasmata archaeon]|nr:MAG: lysine biosynthesis protein LysW [Thermoplasmata archaeon]